MAIRTAPSQEIAAAMPHTDTPVHVDVYSPAFETGQPIPMVNSAYGEGLAPDIRWGELPPGTRALVLLCEDPDATGQRPFVHWLLYNIDPEATGVSADTEATAQEGTNSKGQPGYFGPYPPAGDPPHHYHFQIFALRERLPLPSGAERALILEAMAGRVLGKGELIGTFAPPES